MPRTQQFYGNVVGVPVGSPDDPVNIGEYFPDGQSCQGFVRRGLASEMALDRRISPKRLGREDGYIHGNSEQEIYAMEQEDRRKQRSFRLTLGNVLGTFTGPPDRVR